ncbi:MAG: class I SAM-dependent methyltransferase [Lysobacterales bacterium]
MTQALEFTGERFTPECVREIWYEHFHRYAFAWPAARGRRVLDAACGEGYGSALLAATAASVLGVDISETTVAHARERYPEIPNLRFETHDATALDALPDASFDLIASFETLEHVEAQERMLVGFRRLLAPGGVLLVSSPDKAQYTDAAGHDNPFHVRELYRDEFESLLGARFPATRLFAQKLLFQGALWRLEGGDARFAASTMDAGDASPSVGLGYAPMYYVGACANDEASIDALALPDLHLFGDRAESVYAHYNREVAHIIAAGHALVERDAHIVRLEAECARLKAALAGALPAAPPSPWWQRLRKR